MSSNKFQRASLVICVGLNQTSSRKPSICSSSPKKGRKLCGASCMLILGIPLHVFYPVLLFYLADGGQDVRFTPVQKNGGKLRDKDGG